MNHQNEWALRAGLFVLGKALTEDRFDEIAPDLTDLYTTRCKQGDRFSHLKFGFDVLSVALRRNLRKDRFSWNPHSLSSRRSSFMFKNYLLVAIRHLVKQKGFTFINAFGLAIGLVCCTFIWIFVADELSYDRHVPDAERIYRVTSDFRPEGKQWAPIGPPLGPAMLENFPEIEDMVRFFPSESGVVFKHDTIQLEEKNGGFADTDFLTFFGFRLLEGDPTKALVEPGSVVISSQLATKLFGDASALGQTVSIVPDLEAIVSGVLMNTDGNTHLPVDFLFSMSTFYSGDEEWLESAFLWAGFLTYVKLHSPSGRATIESQIPPFIDKLVGDRFSQPASELVQFSLQPLLDIHLYSHLEKEYRQNGDISYVYTFSIVALFTLILACVNFVNLATSRAGTRIHEVAVRKTFGARRQQLIRQYMGESLLLSSLGFVLSVALIVVLIPLFNDVTAKNLAFSAVVNLKSLAFLAATTIGAGLVAGFYPAIVLSGVGTVAAFRGRFGTGSTKSMLRKGLVVFQFTVSICLIAGSTIIWKQLSYFQTAQLGFDKENVLVVRLPDDVVNTITQSPDPVKSALLSNASIVSVSHASDRPGSRYSIEGMVVEGQADQEGTQMRVAWRTDHDYARTLGLTIIEGRDFSKTELADTSAWLINEAAAKILGLTDPVGQNLIWDSYKGPIVGLIRDFNFASMHEEIEPLVIPLRPGNGGQLLIRFASTDHQALLQSVEETLNQLYPGSLFSFSFLDDSIDALYRGENTLKDVTVYFSVMAILIACLGLFGLAAFTAKQRTREIGVRKVLGATSSSIVKLLSKEFMLLIVISFLIATPLTWMAGNSWLDHFAYRIEIGALVFILAGAIAAVVALAAVGFQAISAASANPVSSLHHE
ncbi:MAG: ABC transporter permease [Bacteroidetes bacterium]|nr:ABC transporter permease [Bacteroidota bacterium]